MARRWRTARRWKSSIQVQRWTISMTAKEKHSGGRASLRWKNSTTVTVRRAERHQAQAEDSSEECWKISRIGTQLTGPVPWQSQPQIRVSHRIIIIIIILWGCPCPTMVKSTAVLYEDKTTRLCYSKSLLYGPQPWWHGKGQSERGRTEESGC